MEKRFSHLTPQEKEAIWLSLIMRRNVIQTGSPEKSAMDANASNEAIWREHDVTSRSSKPLGLTPIKALTTDQMRLCILLEDLINEVMQ